MTRIVDLSGMTAVAYTRVSTEDQASERQTSLADQRAAVIALAGKLGVTIGHTFEDAGFSGATMDHRPAMNSLIHSCKANRRSPSHPGYVLVLNDSRWGRFEKSEHATYWRVEIERAGWMVRFAEMDETQDDTVRPILRAIAQSQASLYRRNLSANVLRGCRGQAEQGYWQAKAPFGYARKVVYPVGRERLLENHVPKATDEKLILTPHQDEAPIVVAIFERYVMGGESISSLLEWATREYPTREWSRAAMLRLLSNPAYTGDVVWGRMHLAPGRRSHRAQSDWYGKRGAHEPIISRELFAAAQARLGTNRRRTRGVRSDWVLSGLVRCRCGKGFTGAGSTGPRGAGPVYSCASRGASAKGRCTYPGAVTKRLLEDAAIGLLAKEIGSAAHRKALTAAIDKALADARATARTPEEIARELEAVKQKQQRLLVVIESGALTSVEASDRLTALRADRERLTLELERASHGTDDMKSWRDQLVAQALDFKTMATELHGAALRELLSLWIARAEFNTTTRELTMEIRRVPASAAASPTATMRGAHALFGTEGDPSTTKRHGTSPLDATITRVVIVGRRRAA